jgi:molecular chaperone DnaK
LERTRKSVLKEAVEKAGMPTYELVMEPVAAAVRISLASTQPGQTIAVYDFGGGTFDAAVLLRTTTASRSQDHRPDATLSAART